MACVNGISVHKAQGNTSRTRLRMLICVVLAALCVSTVPNLYKAYRAELSPNYRYSNGLETAAYIIDELPQDALILLETENHMSSVTVWLPREQIYNLLRDNSQRHLNLTGTVYPRFALEGDFDEALSRVRERYGERPLYLLTTSDAGERVAEMDARSECALTLMQSWLDDNTKNEKYLLYRVDETSEP